MAAMTHDTAPVRATDGRRTATGLGFAALSASAFGLSGSLARGLMDAGWSSGAAVAVRILLAGVVLLPVAVRQLRGRWSLLRSNAALITTYGLVAVAGCQLAYFNAVAHLEVGVALLIEYTAPIAVVGWLWARHRQRPGRLTVLGAVVGATGLVLVLDLTSGGGQVSTTGVLWALAAMAGVAVYFVISADEDNGLPGAVLAAGGLLLGGIVLLLSGLVGIVPFEATTNRVAFDGFTVPWWVPVVVLGVVSAAFAYVAGIAASRRLGSRLASFAALWEVFVALIVAWLLLGEVPGVIQVVGGALILAGVITVKLGEPVTDHDAAPTPASREG